MHHLTVPLAPQRLLKDLLALARGGPNITSQQILRSTYIFISQLAGSATYLSGFSTYEMPSISDQASGPPLTRILSVERAKEHAELQVNCCRCSSRSSIKPFS